MAAIIKVKQLRKVYRVGQEKVIALNNVDLEIEKGEFCCIVGASGSGKSTLLNQLAGLEKPSKGSVIIAGQNVSAMTENELAVFRQNNLGFVFQSYNLLPTLTALENVALPLMFKGMSKAKREKIAAQKLREMGLGKRMRHKPTEMSGGQQQRVGIARAFAANPKVIFADEPTGNLDSHTTAQVMNAVLRLLREHGITFVMVTHEHDLSGCADRIITLKDGCVLRNEKIERPVKVFAEQHSMIDGPQNAADAAAPGQDAAPVQTVAPVEAAPAQGLPAPETVQLPQAAQPEKASKLTVPRGNMKQKTAKQQPEAPAAKGETP